MSRCLDTDQWKSIEEAKGILENIKYEHTSNSGTQDSIAKACDVALRSLEAWGKVKNDLADLWLEGFSPYTEVMEIIDRHLKEVEEK